MLALGRWDDRLGRIYGGGAPQSAARVACAPKGVLRKNRI